MPMIRIRGIQMNKIKQVSSKLVEDLHHIIGCPKDYFTIECMHSTFIYEGKDVEAPTLIEVAWFDRGQEVQDTVAKIITDNIRENLNIESMDLAFTVFEKEKYYENGEHF